MREKAIHRNTSTYVAVLEDGLSSAETMSESPMTFSDNTALASLQSTAPSTRPMTNPELDRHGSCNEGCPVSERDNEYIGLKSNVFGSLTAISVIVSGDILQIFEFIKQPYLL